MYHHRCKQLTKLKEKHNQLMTILLSLRQNMTRLMTLLLNRKNNKITDLVDEVIDESNPFQNIGTKDIWTENDMFDQNDEKDIVNIQKDILKNIRENDSFLDFTILTETIIDDLFEPSDDEKVTLEDVNDEESFEISDDGGTEFILAEPAIDQPEIIVPNTETVSIDSGPKQTKKYITTRMNSAIKAANKIRNKYKKPKKTIGKRNDYYKKSIY